ncbi:MAG: ImmA/IrrE family metallo-endopeptidase [Acutalibacteraceae bacterium]
MNYKKYQNVRDVVWKILIQENITALPIKVGSLCANLGIIVKYYLPNDDNDGYCTFVNDVPYIFVNKNCVHSRKRFTIAHELGHLLLGHVGKYNLVNREPSPSDKPIEHEANVFASRLLAPACVLWGCEVKTAADIVALCDISPKAAEFRMKRMEELYKRNKFLTSPLERQVYAQFKNFIKCHRPYQEDF